MKKYKIESDAPSKDLIDAMRYASQGIGGKFTREETIDDIRNNLIEYADVKTMFNSLEPYIEPDLWNDLRIMNWFNSDHIHALNEVHRSIQKIGFEDHSNRSYVDFDRKFVDHFGLPNFKKLLKLVFPRGIILGKNVEHLHNWNECYTRSQAWKPINIEYWSNSIRVFFEQGKYFSKPNTLYKPLSFSQNPIENVIRHINESIWTNPFNTKGYAGLRLEFYNPNTFLYNFSHDIQNEDILVVVEQNDLFTNPELPSIQIIPANDYGHNISRYEKPQVYRIVNIQRDIGHTGYQNYIVLHLNVYNRAI
jgi:hypothetical protein